MKNRIHLVRVGVVEAAVRKKPHAHGRTADGALRRARRASPRAEGGARGGGSAAVGGQRQRRAERNLVSRCAAQIRERGDDARADDELAELKPRLGVVAAALRLELRRGGGGGVGASTGRPRSARARSRRGGGGVHRLPKKQREQPEHESNEPPLGLHRPRSSLFLVKRAEQPCQMFDDRRG